MLKMIENISLLYTEFSVIQNAKLSYKMLLYFFVLTAAFYKLSGKLKELKIFNLDYILSYLFSESFLYLSASCEKNK